ncbi:MAG: bacillithiol biosynthesis cysteine-adding enzyme BshC [Candidatus Heimdallarchaeota archaeon]|nr:bacillithiol biosynthesis cysteine-adding enzyme BshC [Candidatus Heimdallarchaeota archaeon]
MDEQVELELLEQDKMYPNTMLLDYLNRKSPMYEFIKKDPKNLLSNKFVGNRTTLKEILLKYNKSIGASEETFNNIEQVCRDDVYFVVTGQQPGFLTGPLYTIFKTFSAIIYAEKFSSDKIKLVPLFWNASEDHDIEEVNNIKILDKNNDVAPLIIDEDIILGKSLESIRLDKSKINNLLEKIIETIPKTEYTNDLYNGLIKETLNKSEKWGEFFSRLLSKMMSKWGLILVEPWIFRPYLKEFYTKLVTDPIKYNRIFLQTTDKLKEIGYQPKMHKKEDVVGLFYIDDNSIRNTINFTENKIFEISNGISFTKEEIIAEINSKPERFSTNAIYRPLAQDQMLPTYIFVGGPSEIGYHIQIKDLYTEFGITQPNLQFRLGATVIERHINKIIEKYNFNIAELTDINKLASRLIRDENQDFFSEYNEKISNTLDEIIGNLTKVDAQLGQRSSFKKQNIMKEIESIEKMYFKYIKDDNQLLLNQLEKAKAYLFPSEKPQERVFNIFQYLNKYSIKMLECIKNLLTLVEPGSHVVLKCWMF